MKKSCMNCKYATVPADFPPCDDCYAPGGPADELPNWEHRQCELCQIRRAWTDLDGVEICGPCWEAAQSQIAWRNYTEIIDEPVGG